MVSPGDGPQRETYRHGDLRRALLAVGIELAREGGPEAIVLREATRRVGVAPNAAYRHFADHRALRYAVCSAAQGFLAVAMEEELAALPTAIDLATDARARVRAIGTGYLRFAQDEPGLFRTAFSVPEALDNPDIPAGLGASGLSPFAHLTAALDGLVAAGALPGSRRPGAEYLAWSAVHGLALLAIDGPMRGLPRPDTDQIGQRLLDMVERGL